MEGEMPGGSGELPLVCGYSDEMLTDLQECVWDRTRDTGHGTPTPSARAHTRTEGGVLGGERGGGQSRRRDWKDGGRRVAFGLLATVKFGAFT